MKDDTMKRILWFLTAIGIALVAGAVLLADQGGRKTAEASAFEGKKEAVEMMVMMKEKDGNWKSAGYVIP